MNYNREKVINIIRKIYAVYRGRHLVDILAIILSDYLKHKSTQDEWKESEHPRDKDGKFTDGSGNGSSKQDKPKKPTPTIAGVKKGKQMSFKKANEGKVNPNFEKGEEYQNNCQSCVAVFEARLRGFDIEVQPFNEENSAMDILQYHPERAYIDKTTGEPPIRYRNNNVTSNDTLLKWLDKRIKPKQRYGLIYTNKNGRHIVIARKSLLGQLKFYDPQIGIDIKDNMLKTIIYKDGQANERKCPPEIFRLDNSKIRLKYLEEISRARK